MIPGIKDIVLKDINEKGHSQEDSRLKRQTRAINGYVISHHYIESFTKTPIIEEKFMDDWGRMFRTMTKACNEVTKDINSRRAVIFNTTKYEKNYPCFLTMQLLRSSNGEYDLIVYQRSADLEKLEQDIAFFEYVMYKVSKRINKTVNRLVVMYGSIHYATNE